ncbi:protein KINESIN LIGHT CHAIN-RELATED 1 [Selaginella moellendorffii]|nr:protein KINESIN LIGHT CHAIN-RELATED 1 [Selaginella moellendorffii]|eukprot:XP_002976401.2 protein KINESIN LIGHT CHAIN-RELATED 1 [Selaginella moellendorffii]
MESKSADFKDKENTNRGANARITSGRRSNPPELPRIVPGSPNKPPRGSKETIRRSSNPKGQSPARSFAPISAAALKSLSKSISGATAPQRALDYALQAVKFFEEDEQSGGNSIELAMSLHALAAVHCRLRQFGDAIAALERSIRAPDAGRGTEHALAIFSGYMHLGDTYGLMGRHPESLQAYHTALDLQKKAVGDRDPGVAQTCRYLAEAHLQNLEFDEAEAMCLELLQIHAHIGRPGSVEEAADRRLMALICGGKGQHDVALEYLVLASMSLIQSNGHDLEVAAVEASIGDTYVALGRFDDAVFAYQKALTVFKSARGEDHASVASIYVSLADLYLRTGKNRECRTYCDTALKLFTKNEGLIQGSRIPRQQQALDEIISGLTEIAALYGALDEPERAIQLLGSVLDAIEPAAQYNLGQQSAVAAIEAQMGILYYVLGKFGEALVTFKSAVMKIKAASPDQACLPEKKMVFLGLLLNQMGLACVELYEIVDAGECFQEARSLLEQACGIDHPDTIDVSMNLAATYDALGRLDEAIILLQSIIKIKEEKLGVGCEEIESERKRLNELTKERSRQVNPKP